jgi:3'-5' exoribonuclease
MNKSVFVKDISAGDKVRDVFLVTGKNLAVSQKGNPYLSLRLRDRTGEVEGRVWENALSVSERFEKGDIIEVQARVVSFRNELQLSIFECLPVDDFHINPADFSPASPYDIDEMFNALGSIMSTVENPSLRKLLETTFADDYIAGAFKRAPAAKGFHHAYIGGLLEHTLSVVRLLDLISSHYEGVNRDLLIAGGTLHDIGKIDELSFATIIDYTDEGRLVGHIVRGVEIIDRIIQQLSDFPEQLALELRHILLSHHGLLEFGSPKRPKTLEALMVNFADDLDAKMNAFQYHMNESADDSSWTTYHRLLERYIYKGPPSSGKVSDNGNSGQD